jgi:sugar phosphate isomerase/epimerase
MKLAYGTYAMPTMPLEEAIPFLAGMGYKGIEFCIGPDPFNTEPEQMDAARRSRLHDLLDRYHLAIPALMIIRRSVLAVDEITHQANVQYACRAADLARDLGAGPMPVISMGIGGKSDLWDVQRAPIVARLGEYAQAAAREGFILAGEAHQGAAVDRSARALDVINTIGSPHCRLHFDIVHLFLAGEREQDAVRLLLPITAHTHVSDAHRLAGGGFEFRLPGEGDVDMTAYIKAMHDNRWTGFLTMEISTRLWSQPGYDLLAAAHICYNIMITAFARAGVTLG